MTQEEQLTEILGKLREVRALIFKFSPESWERSQNYKSMLQHIAGIIDDTKAAIDAPAK